MSIFSRLKKPAAAEGAKPAAVSPARGERGSHPTVDSGDAAEQQPPPAPPFPPAPAAKANGVHPPTLPPTPPIPSPPNGASKRPELSNTIAYGAARPAVPPPPAAVPVTIKEPDSGSVDLAIEKALGAEPAAKVAHGASTASDQAALRATFEDLAVPYVAEIRGAMMELQWGEAQASWLEMARPVLRSLRKMAEPVGHVALVEALDRFDAALADVLAPGQPATPSAAARDALLAAYAPLRACLPRAFELQGERDRREPLIVRALLEQVSGLDPFSIEKLMAAGFGKLTALYAGRAEEIAVVSGIADEVAAALVARVQAFRQATPAGLAAVDTTATVRELARLVADLRTQHAAFEGASRNWSEQGRIGKRHLRRERQVSLLQITIELVRLGEVDLVQRLEKLPFNKKIDEVEELIGRTAQSAKAKKREEGRTWVS